MLDRKTAPNFETINKVDVMQVQAHQLNNGIKLYTLSTGSQELTKVEFIFKAGMYHQAETLIASSTNAMLELGTKSFSANEISEGIDFYGSFLELSVEQDYATIALYSLNKHLENSLKYLEEVIKYPTFPTSEFEIFLNNKKQKHFINSEKVNVIAKRRFVEMLYGKNHPYGKNAQDADFERLTIEQLKAFYKTYYSFQNCTIIASGRLPKNIDEVLNTYFGNEKWNNAEIKSDSVFEIEVSKNQKELLPKADAMQSAIRIGRVLFNKTHPDYFHFQILNTIFGGYFGSRLMKNIREDKGYTYGIGSGVSNMVHSGYFYISAEVDSKNTSAALKEIYIELKKLREKEIDENELTVVINYSLGNFLRNVDGPFALASRFRSIWEFGLDYSYYQNYFEAVNSVTPKKLMELANTYFQEKDLLECVAGKM